MAQAFQGDVSQDDVGSHARSGDGRIVSYGTRTQYQNLGRFYSSHSAQQDAFASLRFFEEAGSLLYRHLACYLAHRNQQRQLSVSCSYGFIGYAGCSALQHSIQQWPVTGKMEIGKEQLALAYQTVFRFDGLLDFHYHFGGGIYLFDGRQNLGSHNGIVTVTETAAFSGSVLYIYCMTFFDQSLYAGRSHTYSELIVLDFFGNTYYHSGKFLKLLEIFPPQI